MPAEELLQGSFLNHQTQRNLQLRASHWVRLVDINWHNSIKFNRDTRFSPAQELPHCSYRALVCLCRNVDKCWNRKELRQNHKAHFLQSCRDSTLSGHYYQGKKVPLDLINPSFCSPPLVTDNGTKLKPQSKHGIQTSQLWLWLTTDVMEIQNCCWLSLYQQV